MSPLKGQKTCKKKQVMVDSKCQTKISSFFKKLNEETLFSTVSSNSIHNSEIDKLSSSSLHNINIDLEYNNTSIVDQLQKCKTQSISSPECIPATPNTGSINIIEKKFTLTNVSIKDNIETPSLSSFNLISSKDNSTYSKHCSKTSSIYKRPSESRTGFSPNAKKYENDKVNSICSAAYYNANNNLENLCVNPDVDIILETTETSLLSSSQPFAINSFKEFDLPIKCFEDDTDKTVTNTTFNFHDDDLLFNFSVLSPFKDNDAPLLSEKIETKISEEDIVHILAKETDGYYFISDTEGMIVVNPDFLITGTAVSSGSFCRRKVILNEKFKAFEPTNKLMLIGSLVHELFEQLVTKRVELASLEDITQNMLKRPQVIQSIFAFGEGTSDEELYMELKKFFPLIKVWAKKYLYNKDSDLGNSRSSFNQWHGQILDIEDVEENIWSPRYGIKGKIDLTVKIKCNGNTEVLPLELKTGKPSFSAEHRAQTILYSMMSCDRRPDSEGGLLLYLRNGEMQKVPALNKEKAALVQLRNELVHYLIAVPYKNDDGMCVPNLPEPISHEKACIKCSHLLSCSLYQNVVENHKLDSHHPMMQLVPKSISHLTKSHLEYFRHWCLLLHLEMSVSSNRSSLKDIWCKDSYNREKSGNSIGNLTLTNDDVISIHGEYLHKFIKKEIFHEIDTSAYLQVGESVVVSSEKEIAITFGIIKEITSKNVIVSLERNLKLYPYWGEKTFCLDIREYQNAMGITFCNLLKLFVDSSHRAKLRELIIDKKTPTFLPGLSRSVVSKVEAILKPLNKCQQKAVLRTLMANDYTILRGYSGTGKTSVIIALVKVLVKLGYSVLLASYTHSAVDNILLKLKGQEDFLRLGKICRVHPELLSFSDDSLLANATDVGALTKLYFQKKIVATTCLGINHVIFVRRTFDYCIIDEASQVLQMAAIGPLFYASRFVLVGDSLQLPPVIRSKQAVSLGMSESLFAALENQGATESFTEQYRMNAPIMELANSLTYNGLLAAGNSKIEKAVVDLPHYDELLSLNKMKKWEHYVLNTSLDYSVIFLDTRKEAPESRDSANLIVNKFECFVLVALLNRILEAGLNPNDVGLITPYRAQVKLIHEYYTKNNNNDDFHKVEINTIDQYQGRDKSVIMYSCVRSNDGKTEKGDILQDKRRLSVAITRAKHKLIIIGDISTLVNYLPFQQLISSLKEHQMYSLIDGQNDFSWSQFDYRNL